MLTMVAKNAGMPATPADLINVDEVIGKYYDVVPDPNIPEQRVSFGTSGHRGSSLKTSFNEAHIVAITQAIAEYRKKAGVTGPLYIEGAEPGDALKIEIISIEPEEAGVMCVRTGKGVYQVEGCHCRRFPVKNGAVFFDAGIEIPVQPMIGVIGTCPAIAEDTQSPGEHGGNLDMRDLGAGATLYLQCSCRARCSPSATFMRCRATERRPSARWK